MSGGEGGLPAPTVLAPSRREALDRVGGAGRAGRDLLGSVLGHALSRPGHLALRDSTVSLTYAQLGEAVQRVAAGLAGAGVRQGDRVALAIGNSAPFVTTALGCLWLGAVFVPTAPDGPPARLARVIADCKPTVLVTSDDQVPDLEGCQVPTLSYAQLATATGPVPPRDVEAARDAYIIYTSGTTGAPKGVTIPQEAIAWSSATTARLLGLTPSTRTMAVSPFYFDGAFGPVFATLFAGGYLLVPKREDLLFLRPFFDLLLREEINVTSFTPSYLRLLLASRHAHKLSQSKLKVVALGGEQCLAQDVARLWQLLPGARVFNRYGPTEATVAVTSYNVTQGDVSAGAVPLGTPHPGVEFFIFAEDGSLVEEAGCQGELYISGRQLMSRYWGDEALTRSVLRRDLVRGRVLYKTGDLVYRDEQGRYFYRGRLDDVVKRNGVRISLSEVAGALHHAGPLEGVCCALYDQGGAPGIAAFVEPGQGAELSRSVLVEGASSELPANALPDEIFVVKGFPLTQQGKVDRDRLLRDVGLAPWSERS
ncbi:MAG: AMP-binding protein [Acidimicrobiales bacterium]